MSDPGPDTDQTSAPDRRTVVVFGGTGFLGRRVVRHLLDHGFFVRIASRHPERARRLFLERSSAVESVRADINDDASVAAALAGAFGAVNAVSLYVERGDHTFHSVHVEAAARLARHARQQQTQRLVHVSGIGADPASRSSYIRSRGEGESAVRKEFSGTTIVRPSVMFGPDDAFLTAITGILRTVRVLPMFGRGDTKLQPAYVEDVAEAIVRALELPAPEHVYELAGPAVHTYEQLVRLVGERLGSRALRVPVPFAMWHVLAAAAEWAPAPPVTRNQIELMEQDNVASPGVPGFAALGIVPEGIETTLAAVARR